MRGASMVTKEHAVTIPDDLWEESGEPGSEGSRLLCQIVVNGCVLHLEAYAIAWEQTDRHSHSADLDAHVWQPVRVLRASPDEECNGVQMAADPEWDETIGYVQQAIYGDGAWDTVFIRGREYVLFATPSRH